MEYLYEGEDLVEFYFDPIHGIKIYTGNTLLMRKKYTKNTARYKEILCENEIFEAFRPLKQSTLTIKGKFSNILFHEKSVIGMMQPPTNQHILKIGCNYGEIYNTRSIYKSVTKKPVIHKRNKRTTRPRKIQGSGKYFSSQITFEIYNPIPFLVSFADAAYGAHRSIRKKILSKTSKKKIARYISKKKILELSEWDRFLQEMPHELCDESNKLPIYQTGKTYKIKVFRNGNFQVPGIVLTSLVDILKPLLDLQDYLQSEFLDPGIKIEYITPSMRNYTTTLIHNESLLYVTRLEDIIIREKKNESKTNEIIDILDGIFPASITSKILSYCDILPPIGISDVQYNCERYFGLVIKVHRPVPWAPNKKTTIKVLRSGKINLDGGNSIEEVLELFYWFKCFYAKHYDDIVYSHKARQNIPDLTDIDEGYLSIYDDMIEIPKTALECLIAPVLENVPLNQEVQDNITNGHEQQL